MKKSYLLALLSIAAAFGFTSVPAYADKIINKQIIRQTVNLTGNGNTVNQSAGQTNVQNQRNGGRGGNANLGNYQGINQNANVRGNNNRVNQNAQQVNVQNIGNGNRRYDRDDRDDRHRYDRNDRRDHKRHDGRRGRDDDD